MGRAMLSKSIIQFSVDGWGCVPSLLFACLLCMLSRISPFGLCATLQTAAHQAPPVRRILQARILECVAISFSLLFTWGQTMVEVMKIMATSFKGSHACTATLSAPNPAAGHCQPMPPLETPGHSWASLGQSLVGSLLLSPGSWCTQGSVYALQESVSPVLCKFWRLYGGVNGDLPQGGICHTQVCCTQSPCPCGSPLLTHTLAGDTQIQFWLSL